MNSINSTPHFNLFEQEIKKDDLPNQFSLNRNEPHPICQMAANELQKYILSQTEWQHNFGLTERAMGTVIGKMFGVLVVKNQSDEIGYLAAFSGKLAGGNHHTKFVPPVFDTLAEDGFLNKGMAQLTVISDHIKKLEATQPANYQEKIKALKSTRKSKSTDLQNEIFAQYHFLNQSGKEKSLIELFIEAGYKNPPAGAGECAGPKLLQYAFQNQMRPLAMTEFWWGQSPKSTKWKHKEFYPCCKEKCEPILKHMLNEL